MSFSGLGCCSVCVGEEHHFQPITAEGTYYQLSLHTVSVGLGHMTKVVFVRFSIVKLTFPPTSILCFVGRNSTHLQSLGLCSLSFRQSISINCLQFSYMGAFISSPPFVYYLIIYLYHCELMNQTLMITQWK